MCREPYAVCVIVYAAERESARDKVVRKKGRRALAKNRSNSRSLKARNSRRRRRLSSAERAFKQHLKQRSASYGHLVTLLQADPRPRLAGAETLSSFA